MDSQQLDFVRARDRTKNHSSCFAESDTGDLATIAERLTSQLRASPTGHHPQQEIFQTGRI